MSGLLKSASNMSQLGRAANTGSGRLSPESLCSLAIALWGWQTNLLLIAVPMLLALEARRWFKQRWQLDPKDLKEIFKLSGIVLLMLSVVIVFIKEELFIYTQLQWLPVAAFPLLLAHIYGVNVPDLIQDTFSNPYLRQQSLKLGHERMRWVITLPTLYLALCILAASAADSESFLFYGLATALLLLTLKSQLPKQSNPLKGVLLWALMFLLSASLGFWGHLQLAAFQEQVQQQVIAMLGGMATGGSIDPNSSATQMGSIGRLKLSNKIMFRVKAGDPLARTASSTASSETSANFPLLLREASYNNYQLATWTVTDSLFSPVPPGEDDGEWILAPADEPTQTITISTDLENGDGVLTLPQGTAKVQQLPVAEMQQNLFGAVQVDATGDATYVVQFVPNRATRPTEERPTEADLKIPNVEKPLINKMARELGLYGKSEGDVVRAIADYLQLIPYSLDLFKPNPDVPPISDFLINARGGHCEYFASATALLLREAGIPSRYVVGYSAHEFSQLEGQYIVRSRDAHAWTLAYLNGTWQTIDNTPPDWTTQEQAMTSSFQVVSDFFAFLGFQGAEKVQQLGELGTREVILIVTPLFGFLLWKSARRFQGQRAAGEAADTTNAAWVRLGLDSELYEIEKRLAAQGLQRLAAESFRQWVGRVQASMSVAQGDMLAEILVLHYRYRFDPKGLDVRSRQQLSALSQAWLEGFEVSVSSDVS